MQYLAARMKSYAASLVAYTPINATGSTLSLVATIGPSTRTLDSGEVIVSYFAVDFTITASDFVSGGVQQYPQRGDTILALIGGKTQTYEARANDLREVWEWTDSSKSRFRVHTNLKVSL
jgi:hypothetical protein